MAHLRGREKALGFGSFWPQSPFFQDLSCNRGKSEKTRGGQEVYLTSLLSPLSFTFVLSCRARPSRGKALGLAVESLYLVPGHL